MRFRRAADSSAVQEAVAFATLSAQFAAHQASCSEDKAEVKRRLDKQDQDRERMHRENQEMFGELRAENQRIMRYVWMAAGAFAILQILAGHEGFAGFLKIFH